MRDSKLFRTIEAAAVLLFLVQAVRVLFSVLFGLIYDAVFDETLSFSTLGLIMLCVVAALLMPLATPRRNRRVLLLIATIVAALARIPMTINVPAVRLWSSLAIVATAGVYAATLLRHQPPLFPITLIAAFAADQFLRAAGNTYDVGLRSWWLPVQALLSITVGVIAWLSFSRSPREEPPPEEGIGLLGGLAVGALLFLETSLLGFPNAIARWSRADYAVVTPLLMAVTLLPLMPGPYRRHEVLFGRWSSLATFTVALIVLSTGSGGTGLLSALLHVMIQYSLLVACFCVIDARNRDRAGLALGVGMLLFLLLNFALAFAFTYPYTIPVFRDKGRYGLMAAAAFVYLPTLRPPRVEPSLQVLKPLWTWSLGALAVVAAIACAWPTLPVLSETGPVRVGTYNIHYGYNTDWHFSLEAQARTIEESGADIMALQEVDACRITSYGVDDALWLARRLRMQEVYAPTLEGLSGIALLSRFPISESDVHLLTSRLEQTAIAHAVVQVDGQLLNAYATWLGLEPEERERQLDDALTIISEASPVVLGGDFNATPDSPVYACIAAAGFDDPFVAGGFDPALTAPATEPVERIDYVWTRGLEVQDAQVLDALTSDHRIAVVEVALP